MKEAVGILGWWLVIVALAPLGSGCAAFRARTRTVDVGEERHMDAEFDATDMRAVTASVVGDMLAADFLQEEGDVPVLIVAGIQNRTSKHTDMKLLSDRIRTLVMASERAQFVNEARRDELMREQAYQAQHVTPETQAAIGQQLGARYMLSGSLAEMRKESSRQVRLSKRQWNYFNLTVEVTDLETGLIAWTTEKEFAREARKPLIGW